MKAGSYTYGISELGVSIPLGMDGRWDHSRPRTEYRLQITEQARDVGRLRLVAAHKKWALPTCKIVKLLDDYWNGNGAKNVIKRPMIAETGGACFVQLDVLDYEARIGPLNSANSRVFLFDQDGGCVGHFPLEDLPGVRNVLSDLWRIEPGPDFLVNLYLSHTNTTETKETMKTAIESNPKKLRDQARTLGIDPKGLKIGDLKKVVQKKLDEATEEEEPDIVVAAPPKKKGGGKKKAPLKAGKKAPQEDSPAALDAVIERLTAAEALINRLQKEFEDLENLDERLDELQKSVDDIILAADVEDEDEGEDGNLTIPEKYQDLLEDVLTEDDDGNSVFDYQTMDVDSLNLKQIEAIREVLGFTWDEDKIKGIRQKRSVIREFQARMLQADVDSADGIEGPNGETAKACTPDDLEKGDRVWIVDSENVWYQATVDTNAASEEDEVAVIDEDGDYHITVTCDDGEVASVYFLPEGEADPRFVGKMM